MSDLSITATSVVAGSTAQVQDGTCGETITAGQALYKAAATGLWMKADNNSATAEVRAPTGIALNGGAINQPIRVLTKGPVTIGAALTAGVAVYLSDTAGGLCLIAGITSGMYPTIVGIATSASVLDVLFHSSGVAL